MTKAMRNVMVTFVVAVCATVTGFAQSGWADWQQISHDPYTDPAGEHATEVEPLMVAHGNTIVASIQVGRFNAAGADNTGWATSQDGGKSWKHGFLTGLTTQAGGTWPAVSLPTVAYDEKHHSYLIASMPFDSNGDGRGVLVNRSYDGLKWSAPVVADTSMGTNGHWLACDNSRSSPFYGNCYDAIYDYATGNYLNQIVVSDDGGVTWSSPAAAPDLEAGLVTSVAIQPNGHLLILGRNGGINGDQEYAIPSVDGGHTLGARTDIATIYFTYPYMRADPSITSAVDAHGTIYVVFPDCRFRSNCSDPVYVSGCRYTSNNSACPTNDLVMTKSEDGLVWSPLQRIPIDPVSSTGDHLIAGLAALTERDWWGNEHVRLALTYYVLPNGRTCVDATCEISAGFISSGDGGKSWHPADKVAGPMKETWLAPTIAGEMVANYNSAVFVEGKPHGAFALACPPNRKTGQYDEAIYAGELAGDQ